MDTEKAFPDEPEVLSSQQADAELAADTAEINRTALYVGTVILVIVCALFALLKAAFQQAPFFDYPAMIFLVLSGVGIYKFQREQKAFYLFSACACLAGALCLILLFFLNR